MTGNFGTVSNREVDDALAARRTLDEQVHDGYVRVRVLPCDLTGLLARAARVFCCGLCKAACCSGAVSGGGG